MLPHLKNIYLADDDMDDIAFFQEALNTICSDCTLIVSKNGEELIKKLLSPTHDPEIIFIDINMPGMNGLEALKIIKENSLHNAAPIITYSTSSNPSTIELAKAYGANFYIIKPADFDKLKEKIGRLLFYNWNNWTMPDEMKTYVF